MNVRLWLPAVFLMTGSILLAQDSRTLLNRSMPNWLDLGVQARWRPEGQRAIGFQEGAGQDFFNQRYRFSVGIKPTPWLKFFGEFQDSRAPGLEHQAGNVRDVTELRQAWVDIGNEGGWWDLKAGRQPLAFGSDRVVGASEWGNVPRVFDAVRLGIHHGSDRVDFFASSVVRSDADAPDHHQQGNNLHGVYGSFGSWIHGSKIEPYLLWRSIPFAVDEMGRTGKADSYTYGLRSAGAITPKWVYEAEIIGQRGAIVSGALRSWAATAQAQRILGSLPWKPSLLAEYNYASGDRNPKDNTIGTFDQLYPTNHSIYGVADQIGRRNTSNVRGGIWLRPHKSVLIKTEGHSFWLASRYDALYAANGAVSVPAVAGGAKYGHVGTEFDITGEVKLSRYYVFGAQFGHLFPGRFLETYTPGVGHAFYAVYLDIHL